MPTRIAKPVLMVGMFGGSLLKRGPLPKDKGGERRIEVARTGPRRLAAPRRLQNHHRFPQLLDPFLDLLGDSIWLWPVLLLNL
jgi:hypothetical protein